MTAALLGSVFAFLALASLGTWHVQRSGSRLDARVRALAAERRSSLSMEDVPFTHRVIAPATEGVITGIISLLPPAFIARTRKRLTAAGQPISLPGFFTLALVTALLLPAVIFPIIWAAAERSPPAGAYLLIPIMAAVGLLLPFAWLWRRVRHRQLIIWRSLPDTFDLMTTCVEAGLGLDSAFHRVCEKLEGPVTEEFAAMLREVALGKSRRQALRDMGERTGVGELQSFANTIIQAEELGTNVADGLRAQATQMRVRRRQRAEEEARRAPAKMVFPLVFFILPSLFVVILGPVMIELFKVLGD
jgi:tight adherence protein C